MYKVGIIGAGICGLSTATTLHKNQIEFKIFESSNEPGGCIKTFYDFNSIIETGPNSINGRNEDINDLINYLSIESECYYSNEKSKNRYILKNNKALAVPVSPNQIVKNKILSISTKLKIINEMLIKSKSNSNESLEEFILRRFDQEFLDYIINPFVNGIYAGNPSKLIVSKAFPKLIEMEKKYGSIVKGFINVRNLKKSKNKLNDHKVFTFKNGLQTLPLKMVEHFRDKIKYNHRVQEVNQHDKKIWSIDNESFSHLVFTQPAYTFDNLKSPLDLSFLKDIYYSPVTTVNLLYDRKQFKKDIDGFGILVPECENKFILGVLFPSIIFPNRCPDDKILLTVYVGGAIHPERAVLNQNDLINKIKKDLADFLYLEGNPEHFKIIRWEKAIPQYEANILNVHKKILEIENEYENIFFGGNYIGGISLPNAISTGINIGKKIVKDIKNRKVL